MYKFSIEKILKRVKKSKSALYAGESAYHADFRHIFSKIVVFLHKILVKNEIFNKILRTVQVLLESADISEKC